ncbi:hypothetical protein CAP35_02035 [Chitinophagaceae bacterium IBVUCB1]|nr:hypothetical protein CAP35_02035 [Chitinophagaceae bacterium IBVUCB1]
MKRLILVVLTSGTLLTACVKTETVKPVPAPVVKDTILTAEKLEGKWDVIYSSFVTYKNGEKSESLEWIKTKGHFIDGNGPVTRFWNDSTDISFITFHTDGSFQQTKRDGTQGSYMLGYILPGSGKWILKDSTIILTTYIDGGTLDYTYELEDNELVVTGLETETRNGADWLYINTFVIRKE